MANLIELSKMAESMPDEQLVQAAQGQGSFPAYVAITEVKRRADLRKAYDAQVAQAEMPQATIAEQVISEYVQPGLQGMAQQAMPSQPQGFQEGGSTAFTPKSAQDFYSVTGAGFQRKFNYDEIDKYLLSAGLDPEVLANASEMQKLQYVKQVERYHSRSLPEGFNTADPISQAAVTIDESPEVVPGSATKEITEPMVDQPPVNTLADYSQITDLIMETDNFESTPINVPQSVKDLRSRVAAKKDKPVQGLQAIDIPIKSAEEKQNEREVSALGDLAIAISGAKNLGEFGVGLGQASKGVQAIKDRQEAQTLDAQLKQRDLQRQDIEFTRAQNKEVDEAMAKIAGIDIGLDDAQRNADSKERERLAKQKESLIKNLSDVEKLKIYRQQIIQGLDKNENTRRTQMLDTAESLRERLVTEVGLSDKQKAKMQKTYDALMSTVTAQLINTKLVLSNDSDEVGMTDFFKE